MQTQKSNTLVELNNHGILCFDRDSYMLTSGIAAPRLSHRQTFHIARRNNGLLPT